MLKLIALGVMLSLAAVAAPAQASHSKTVNYVASTPGLSLVRNIVSRDGVPAVGYGGYIFKASSHAPTKIALADTVGLKKDIAVTVCQTVDDTGPSQTCGDPGTVSFDACTNSSGVVSFTNRGLVANVDTAVFVKAADTECQNVATVGTLTMYW